MSAGDALDELRALTALLRAECPWDREQTARTIVPHTVEEAYEVAEAAFADDPEKLRDELGDLLFQVFFLSRLLEEQGAGDLEDVARDVHAKLVRRHPHVFGEAEASTPGHVRVRWEAIKAEQEGREGVFHDVPDALPARRCTFRALRERRSGARAARDDAPLRDAGGARRAARRGGGGDVGRARSRRAGALVRAGEGRALVRGARLGPFRGARTV